MLRAGAFARTLNPKTGAGEWTGVQALDAMIPRLPEVLGDEPLVEAHVRELIATKLLELGRYEETELQRRRVLELLDSAPGANVESRAGARVNLARILLERDAAVEARVNCFTSMNSNRSPKKILISHSTSRYQMLCRKINGPATPALSIRWFWTIILKTTRLLKISSITYAARR